MNQPKIKILHDDKAQIKEVRVVLNPASEFHDKNLDAYNGLVSVAADGDKGQIRRITVHCDKISGRNYENSLADLIHQLIDNKNVISQLTHSGRQALQHSIDIIGKDRLDKIQQFHSTYNERHFGTLSASTLDFIKRYKDFCRKSDLLNEEKNKILAIIDASANKPIIIEELFNVLSEQYLNQTKACQILADVVGTKYPLVVLNLFHALTKNEYFNLEAFTLCNYVINMRLPIPEKYKAWMEAADQLEKLPIKITTEACIKKGRSTAIQSIADNVYGLEATLLKQVIDWTKTLKADMSIQYWVSQILNANPEPNKPIDENFLVALDDEDEYEDDMWGNDNLIQAQ